MTIFILFLISIIQIFPPQLSNYHKKDRLTCFHASAFVHFFVMLCFFFNFNLKDEFFFFFFFGVWRIYQYQVIIVNFHMLIEVVKLEL